MREIVAVNKWSCDMCMSIVFLPVEVQSMPTVFLRHGKLTICKTCKERIDTANDLRGEMDAWRNETYRG